jgi:hypothetical protein
MRRVVAFVGALFLLLLIPAGTALAAPVPSPTPAASQPAAKPGLTLRLGLLSLNVPLAVHIPGLLDIGSDATTPTPPTSAPPTSGGGSGTHTTPAPPPSTHHQSPPATHPPTTSAAPPPPNNNGGGFQSPGGGSSPSSRTHPSSHPPTSASSSAKDSKGTGALVLTRRLLSNSGEVMIAAILAATAIAVIAFARLGGVRRGRQSTRQH